MAAPRTPVSNANHAVGYAGRLVTISSITPDGTTAVCVDRQGYEVRVSMLIQPAKGILPAPGEQWIVTQDVTNAWTFAAIATSDPTVFTNPELSGTGPLPPDILPPYPPPGPGTIPGDAIEPGSLTGAQIAAQTITSLNLATAAAATNIIIDPQFTSAPINAVRAADPGTACTWTFASPNASVSGSGAGICTLALMPSTLVPLYVNPAEQYYLSVSVTLPGGTGPGVSAGIQLVLNDGSFLGPLQPVSGITQTVAQLVTIPPGISSCYVRLIITGLPTGVVATFSAPTLYITQGPSQIQANSISANNLQANSVSTNALQANSVTAAQIAAGAVTAGSIAANAVTAGTIAANAVTAGTIAANAVTTSTIAAGAVTATQIAANTITAAQLQAGIVVAGIVDATTIQGATLIAGTAPNPQVEVTTTAGTGNVIVAFNQASIINGYLQGAYFSTWAQMLLQGPRKNVPSYSDWVGIELNSSDGSSTSASLQVAYNTGAATPGTLAMINADWNGVTLYNVNTMSAAKPGTGGSAANPVQQETWHPMTLINGWVNQAGQVTAQYRITPDGDNVEVIGCIQATSASSSTFWNIPVNYRPSHQQQFAAGINAGAATGISGFVTVSGTALSTFGITLGAANSMAFHGFYSLTA